MDSAQNMREQCYIGSYDMTEAILGVLASIKLVLGLLDHVKSNAQRLNQWLLNISGEYSGVYFVY